MATADVPPQARLDARAWDDLFPAHDGAVRHPLLKPGALQARPYQTTLAARALDGPLLVVLPTGLGKTAIAVLAAAETLRRDPSAKVLMLAPTRPLVLQHAALLRLSLELPEGAVAGLTGTLSPAERTERFAAARVVVSTPQGLGNDVAAARVALDEVGLLVMDEAHRSVGRYAYVPLAEAYRQARGEHAPMLALTASPGGRRERIKEVMDTLGVRRVEARRAEDPDVAPFVKETRVAYRSVPLPRPMQLVREDLEAVLKERVLKLKPFWTRRTLDAMMGKGALLQAGDIIRARMGASQSRGFFFAAIHHQGVALQAAHALEVLETQGLHPLRHHLERILAQEKPGRAQSAFVKDPRVQRTLDACRRARVSHPKENALVETLVEQYARNPNSLVLVFAQYRDTVRALVERVRASGYTAERFVGQSTRNADDEGLSQEDQARVLRDFAMGRTNVLVATSVAEEGLHVPSVDLVVFYEPVASEIRTIQRRGRTGRDSVGRVIVLAAQDTRDSRTMHVEAGREVEMRKVVDRMRRAQK